MADDRNLPEELSTALGFDPAAEGLEPGPSDAAELLAAARALETAAEFQAAHLPEPDEAATAKLVAQLLPLLPAADRALDADRGGWLAGALTAVWPQVRLLRRPFWLASAAVVAAGLPLLDQAVRAHLGIGLTYGAFLVLVAPVLAILGVIYAFRGAGTGMAEVEMTCALTPAQLVLGRLFWVAAYDAALLGAGSLAAAGVEPGVRLGWLVLGWLLPMMLLAAGTLALSLYVPPWAGGMAALAAWAAALVAVWTNPDLTPAFLTIWPSIGALAVTAGVGALALTAAVAAAAPRLAGRLAGLGAGEGV